MHFSGGGEGKLSSAIPHKKEIEKSEWAFPMRMTKNLKPIQKGFPIFILKKDFFFKHQAMTFLYSRGAPCLCKTRHFAWTLGNWEKINEIWGNIYLHAIKFFP